MALDVYAAFMAMKGEEVETPSRGQRISIVDVTGRHVVVQRLDARSRRVDRVPLRVLNDVAARVQAGEQVPTSSITDNMNGPVAALLNALPWVVVDGRPQVARGAPGYSELSARERSGEPFEPMPTGWEGDVKLVLHFRRERDPAIRRSKLAAVLEATGALACEVCGFDFADRYGETGRGFAECHHLRPLAEGGREARLEDLAVVCANCHRMVHSTAVPLEIDVLRGLLR